MRARPSINKRAREKDRAERKIDKAQRRVQRKEERANAEAPEGDVDPDIDWIKPGPQKLDPELFGLTTDTDE